MQCKTATSQEEARFIRKHGLQEEKFDLHGSFTDEEAATAEIYASPRPAADYLCQVRRLTCTGERTNPRATRRLSVLTNAGPAFVPRRVCFFAA